MTVKLQVGQSLPELEVKTMDKQVTTVQTHLGPNWTLLYFLHGAWCPECVGQYHLLQRYQARIRDAGANLVVITGEPAETLNDFVRSAHPSLDYMILTDPERNIYRALGVGNDMVALIVDSGGTIRWLARWPDHQGEPGYETMLQALHEVRAAEAESN